MPINKHTPKSRLLVLLLILALIISSFIQTPLPVQAAGGGPSVSVTVDSVSADFGSLSSKFKGGVTYARTGYLCYLVKADGGLIDGMQAKAFKCEGYNALGGEEWMLKSKKGNYGTEIRSWTKEAPWKVPCFNEDATSNEPKIKAWMTELNSDDVENGTQFVYDYWGDTIGEKFYKGEYVLVLENILSFQPATVQKITEDDIRSGKYKFSVKLTVTLAGQKINVVAYGHKDSTIDEQTVKRLLLATGQYTEGSSTLSAHTRLGVESVNTLIKQKVNQAIKDFVGDNSEGTKTGKGSPVIGTLAQCIAYETSVGGDPSIFASYTNRVACFSEYIGKGGAGEKAGFKPWTGAIPQKPDKLSDSQVAEYGVGMMVVSAKDAPTEDLQTTCDEPEQPEPHDPPDETTGGSFKIVKSYRKRNTTTNTLEKVCDNKVKEDSDYKIQIEKEDEWTLIGWKTSTTYDKTVDPTKWETEVPTTHIKQGTSPELIEMKNPETTLYILFEKSEGDPTPVTGDADFIVSQSTITRKIKVSFPDFEKTDASGNKVYLSGERLLKDVGFKWERDGYKCSHPYTYTDDCKKDVEGESCPGHTGHAGCTWGTFTDNSISFSLKNNSTYKDDYPDILVPKNGWEAVIWSETNSMTKRTKPNTTTAMPGTSSYTIDCWDYACVLMRGADKLTLAKWKNASDSLNTGANDLEAISDSGFAVGDSSTANSRKKSAYNDSFTIDIVDDSSDLRTVATPTSGNGHGTTCDSQTDDYSIQTTYSSDIEVKVETYSGSAGSTTVDTTCNSNPTNKGKFNHYSDFNTPAIGKKLGEMDKIQGVEVSSGNTIKFRPYIQMNYDVPNFTHRKYGTPTTEPKKAYVLGDYDREIAPNDYAEVSWKSTGGTPNLTLNSLQWSTHASAVDFITSRFGASNLSKFKVLPGGATLDLTIKNSDKQTVMVTTYQCVLDGTGKTQVEKTTGLADGTYSGLTIDNAKTEHTSYVNTVKEGLENLNIEQWIINKVEDKNVWDVSGSTAIDWGDNLKAAGHPNQTASTEDKYYFAGEDYNTNAPASEGDFDVEVGSTAYASYTFYMNTYGDMYMITNKTDGNKNSETTGTKINPTALTGIAKELNDRTHVIDKLYKALEHGTGHDASGRSKTGTAWYNEAFDGITVYVQTTQLTVGYLNPPQRSVVLDPKLTQTQTSHSDMFNKDKYNMTQYKTKKYSDAYGAESENVVGKFKDKEVQMMNMSDLFFSQKFFIPNATVDDLH